MTQSPQARAREVVAQVFDEKAKAFAAAPLPNAVAIRIVREQAAEFRQGKHDDGEQVHIALRAISAAENAAIARVREGVEALLIHNPNWIEDGIPDAAIEAGIDAWDKAKHDMENYVSGETADWDEGMIVATIFKAVGRAALDEVLASLEGMEVERG